MATPAEYRLRAAELVAKAQQEPAAETRIAYKLLAQSYLGLAELAERNSRTDLVYETPPAPRTATGEAEPT
jgi:hypothetical protein